MSASPAAVQSARIAVGLRAAETRLRARGWTGAAAFDALVAALLARVGEPVNADPAAIDAVADLPLGGGHDLLGLAYERFFADLFKGRHGQYFTPRPLVTLLLARSPLRPGHTVLDPTCGSGAFLVQAARQGARVRGIEVDPRLASLATTHLRLAGVEGQVDARDFFSAPPVACDGVLANPPFSVEIRDAEVLSRYELGAGRRRALSDWLFVEALERWVRPGGWAALVLPWTIVGNPSTAPLRARIDAAWHREAVCALPEGVFRPFGGAAGRACLLWLRRRAPGDASVKPCEWASLADPGYDVRSSHYRATSDDEVDALCRGVGWTLLPEGAWTPAGGEPRIRSTRTLGELVRHRDERCVPARGQGQVTVVDLADVDRRTGEISAANVVAASTVRGPKSVIHRGDVLVSRLRPELGTVAVAAPPVTTDAPLVGSAEWIVLADASHYVLHAIRTPTWREGLGPTGGQTHPRTTPEAVLGSPVPWPGAEVADRVHALSVRLHEERLEARLRLDALQAAVDAFAAGDLDADGLAAALDEVAGWSPRAAEAT